MADDVEMFIEGHGLREPVLIGHSMFVVVASSLARQKLTLQGCQNRHDRSFAIAGHCWGSGIGGQCSRGCDTEERLPKLYPRHEEDRRCTDHQADRGRRYHEAIRECMRALRFPFVILLTPSLHGSSLYPYASSF